MSINVVTAIFENESEGFQTLTEMRHEPSTASYTVAEAVLIKNEGDRVVPLDAFENGVTSNSAAKGMMVGSIAGILGGPLGVLLGAGIGAATGGMVETLDFLDNNSLLCMVASKLYEGEVAIIALVNEDEPAFDGALVKYNPTIIRRDAEAVAEEVALAVELAAELENEERGALRAEKKAELKARYEERKAAYDQRHDERIEAINDRFETLEAKREALAAELEEVTQAQAEAIDEAMEERAKAISEDDKHTFGL